MSLDWSASAREWLAQLAEGLDRGAKPSSLAAVANRLVDTVAEADLGSADPMSVRYLLQGALEIETSLRAGDDESPAMRFGVETMRQSLERLQEDEVVADNRPLPQLIDWLLRTTHVSPSHLARLLGVAPSTLRRWSTSRSDDPTETDEMQRVRVLAHVVQSLDHVLTARGVVSWLETDHPLLKNRAPAELISEPHSVPELVGLASQGRSQVAS